MKCARGQGRSQVGRGRGERGKEDKINIKLDVEEMEEVKCRKRRQDDEKVVEEDVLEENKAV